MIGVPSAMTPGEAAPVATWSVELRWASGLGYNSEENRPLDLVAFPEPCTWRRRMVEALDTSGRAWRIAFTSRSVAAVQAAVENGLGVALLTPECIRPATMRSPPTLLGLPEPLVCSMASTPEMGGCRGRPTPPRGTGLIPGDAIKRASARGGIPDAIDFVEVSHVSGGTCRLVFKAYEQNRESFQASRVDVILLDEEPPLPIYTEALTRTLSTVPGEPNGTVMCAFPLFGCLRYGIANSARRRLPDD